MPEWFFNPLRDSDVRRDPSEDQFFKHDQENEETYAGVDNLVCEVLQNSLDAAVSETAPVRVRFAIHERSDLSNQELLQKYFIRLEEPLRVYNNSFDFANATEGFLVVEDFGTSGLKGDVKLFRNQSPNPSGEDFYYFWRNVGRSAKSNNNLGRWGIGKVVYKQASNIGCFFGLTIRQSDKPQPYLMGQAILKIHQHNGQECTADGYWGQRDNSKADNVKILPLTDKDKETIQKFCEEWKITRKNEPGLSVVVPFVHSGLNGTDILQTAAVHFFEKILQGKLEVEIESPDITSCQLTATTIDNECRKIKWNGNKILKRNNAPPFEFIRNCLAMQKFVETKPLGKDKVPELNEESFDINELKLLRQQFSEGKLVALKVSMDLSKVVKMPTTGLQDSFLVFVQKTQEKEPETYFVRAGMTVLKPKSTRAKSNGVRGFVHIEKDGTLASMLGDAEGPAHEDWNTSEKRLQTNWKTGTKGRIEFVKKIVDLLYMVLTPSAEKADFNFLSGYFSLLEPKTTNGNKGGKNDGENGTVVPSMFPEEKPKWYKLQKIARGFSIKSDDALFPPKEPILEITAAYDIPRGNPFKKWSKFDFDFNTLKKDSPKPTNIKLTQNGGTIKFISGNTLHFIVNNGADFLLSINGFDRNRDLVVKVEEMSDKETEDENENTD
ncbi:MAG: hypothetical protein LBC02_11700 [Planctomycetaceae bacterium]|jgi:hypothetical protein|nr:hypothetical protein [Planctomycetaceae bacterium]